LSILAQEGSDKKLRSAILIRGDFTIVLKRKDHQVSWQYMLMTL